MSVSLTQPLICWLFCRFDTKKQGRTNVKDAMNLRMALGCLQVLLIFPGLHTVVHHLGHGAWRKQLVWGLIGYFLLVSLVVIGYMLVSHTALACTGHTTHTWKQQQRAVKAVRANGVKTRLKDSRLTVSEMVGNFLWFLWSPQAYAVRVSMQRDGTSLGQRSLRYDGTCVGRVSRCVDTCCDNDFFSCC